MRKILLLSLLSSLLLVPSALAVEPTGPKSIAMEVKAVNPEAGYAEGLLHCVPPEMAGRLVKVMLSPELASQLTVGQIQGLKVNVNFTTKPPTLTAVELLPEPPCRPGDKFAGDPDKPECPNPDRPQDPNHEQDPNQPQDDEHPAAGFEEPTQEQKPRPCEGNAPKFKQAFLSRVWKFKAEANSFENGVLDVTLEKILNLPKKFKAQDDQLVDENMLVLVSSKTRVYQGKKRVKASALEDAESVRFYGKLLPPNKWQTDEDGQKTPTVRAKKIYIED